MSERDTQFAGFATALLKEIYLAGGQYIDASEAVDEQWQKIIARRAYDLVRHALDCTGGGFYASHYTAEGEDMADVDDLTEWPEVKSE